MKVVIGYDGSRCARDAIADLRRAGLPPDTEATVLAVADVFPPPPPSAAERVDLPAASAIACEAEKYWGHAWAQARQAVTEAGEVSEAGATRLRELYPGWSVRAESSADGPHWALVAKAGQSGADLIVVGSHGRSALSRLTLGSVSQQVLQYAPCSVRIARCAPEAGGVVEGPVRLLLGIDGSVVSATAASAVAARAWPTGSQAVVVGVLDSHAVFAGMDIGPEGEPGNKMQPDPVARLEASLKSAGEALRRSGLSVTTSLLTGDAKRTLLAEAERHDVDCIFLGAKGHSRIDRLLLGSVSATVAARAYCSVEVVRAIA